MNTLFLSGSWVCISFYPFDCVPSVLCLLSLATRGDRLPACVPVYIALVFCVPLSCASPTVVRRRLQTHAVTTHTQHTTHTTPETMDYGYPQILSIDVLRTYINLGTIRSIDGDPQESGQLTSQITGAIDWRREGIRHRKNEVMMIWIRLVLHEYLCNGGKGKADASRVSPAFHHASAFVFNEIGCCW